MDHNIINGINEIYAEIKETYTVQGHARIGSTAAKATDASVSSAVDKALANKGTAASASSEKGRTGVTGGGSFRMGGSIGGGSAPKPRSNPNNTAKPQPPTGTKPPGKPDSVRKGEPPKIATDRPKMDSVRKDEPKKMDMGRKDMVRMDTTSDLDTYNLVLEYLLDEGFASSEQSADKIILNMSESWFEEIMEATRAAKEGKKDEHRVGVAIRADQAKKSLEAKAKRDKEIDKYEKESGRKVDRTKSKEYKSHAEYFGGSRQEKKVKGEKESESETQNRRAGRQVLRVLKHGHTEKEKAESKAREKYDSARD